MDVNSNNLEDSFESNQLTDVKKCKKIKYDASYNVSEKVIDNTTKSVMNDLSNSISEKYIGNQKKDEQRKLKDEFEQTDSANFTNNEVMCKKNDTQNLTSYTAVRQITEEVSVTRDTDANTSLKPEASYSLLKTNLAIETSSNKSLCQTSSNDAFLNKNNNFPKFTPNDNFDNLTLAIIDEKYPNVMPMENSHLSNINRMLNYEIDQLSKKQFIPRFLKCFLKNGVILVEPYNIKSMQWLKTIVPKLLPEPGVRLKATAVKNLYRIYTCEILIPHENDATIALQRIKKQNRNIDTSYWTLILQKPLKKHESGVQLHVGIPGFCMEYLETKDLKIFHGVEQIKITILDKLSSKDK